MRLSRANLCAFLVCLLSIIGSGCANEAVHSMHELEPFFSHKTPPLNVDEVPLEDEGVQEDESPALFAETPQIALFEKHSSGDVVRVLGIESEGSVCCVSSKPGRVDCFIRGPWSNVLHMSVENGVYSDWDNLGGWITGDIECVSRKEDFVDILSTDSANHIMVKQYTGGEWSKWQKGADIVMETPSCVVRTSEVVECVVLHINARLYNLISIKGTFSLKLLDLGGSIRKRPTYGSFDEKSTTYFAVNSGNKLQGRTLTVVVTKPVWGPWFDLELWTRERPSVTSWPGKQMHLFALDMRNEIMHKTFNGEWSAWLNLGGKFESAPECVSTGPSTVYCFAIGRDMFLYGNTLDGWEWSGWNRFSIDTRFFDKPSCVILTDSKISCYLISTGRKVVELIHAIS